MPDEKKYPADDLHSLDIIASLFRKYLDRSVPDKIEEGDIIVSIFQSPMEGKLRFVPGVDRGDGNYYFGNTSVFGNKAMTRQEFEAKIRGLLVVS